MLRYDTTAKNFGSFAVPPLYRHHVLFWGILGAMLMRGVMIGLRSLYFALGGMLEKFRYLKLALALVLMVVGVKMMVAKWLKEMLGNGFNFYLLGVVLLILGAGVAVSLIADRRGEKAT